MTDLRVLDQVVEESLLSELCRGEDVEVLQTILRHRETLPPTRFDCGLDDRLVSANRELHRSLEEEGVEMVPLDGFSHVLEGEALEGDQDVVHLAWLEGHFVEDD